MPRVSCRDLTLADIMVLVGATGVGFAMSRAVLAEVTGPVWSVYPMAGGSPLLISSMIALLALRLKRPRPPIGRIFRQPGAAALMSAWIVIFAWSVILGSTWFLGNTNRALNGLMFCSVGGGAAVLGVWTLMIVTRTCRFESGWIDGSGVALGVGWVVLMFLSLIRVFVA